LKTDEEKLRKLINFVKPFELPEIKPPPVRVIEERDETTITKTEQKTVKEDVSIRKKEVEPVEGGEKVPSRNTDAKVEGSLKESPSEFFGKNMFS
jgi:hypothetical protein